MFEKTYSRGITDALKEVKPDNPSDISCMAHGRVPHEIDLVGNRIIGQPIDGASHVFLIVSPGIPSRRAAIGKKLKQTCSGIATAPTQVSHTHPSNRFW